MSSDNKALSPYSNSRIIRRCAQLGIPYAEAIGSPYFAQQGLVAPQLFVQYTEGAEGHVGPPGHRRPLDSLKTLPHDFKAVRDLLLNGPVRPLVQGAGQQGPKRDHVGVVAHWNSSDRSEAKVASAVYSSMTGDIAPNPFGDLELDLTDIVAEEDDELTFVEVVQPRERAAESYVPPALPRERWRVVVNAGHDEDIEWSIQAANIVIDGEGWLAAPRDGRKRKNNDFKKPGKRGRKSTRRSRSIRGSWVSLDPVTCRAWCEAVVEQGRVSERDLDELVANCHGDTSMEDLRIHVTRALEGFGLEADSESDVTVALWDQPTDVDPDELFAAVDAVLNRSMMLPGTTQLTMERASDEAELQALLAARQELLQEILSHDSALQAAIHLRLSGNHDRYSELQTLLAWIDSGRPTHGKAWRAAVTAAQMFRLSLVEFGQVVNESVLKQQSEADTRNLTRAFKQYRSLLTQARIRYLPYVRRIVSRNLARHEEMEDAFQAATFGLFRALDLLNGKSASAFRFYAANWINQRFLDWRARHGGLVRIPINRLTEMRDFERAKKVMWTGRRQMYDQDGLANQLGWMPKKVAEFEPLLRTPVPLSDRRLEAGWVESPMADFDNKELREVIDAAISSYGARDYKVMWLYYGLDGGDELTLEEIGSMLGVTRERIRQLRDRMLDRLRASASQTGLIHFVP